jgi:hypothetical protein
MEEVMALQDGHREAGLAASMAFAVWFDHFRLKKMIVLHVQVEASQTFLMVEIDRRVDKLGGDNFEVCHSRPEQRRRLVCQADLLES